MNLFIKLFEYNLILFLVFMKTRMLRAIDINQTKITIFQSNMFRIITKIMYAIDDRIKEIKK